MALVTLTTDFGLADGYVGAMKGVLAQHAPAATVIDITHDIEPHDVLVAINDRIVASVDDIHRLLMSLPQEVPLTITIIRNDRRLERTVIPR